MTNTVEAKTVPGADYLRRAKIVEPGPEPTQYQVRIERPSGASQEIATLALPVAPPLCFGYDVLVAEGDDALYIIGVVPPAGGTVPAGLCLQSGEQALLRRGAEGDTLELRNAEGELLFSYDAKSGRARLSVAKGDLDLVTEDGSINIAAAHALRMSAPHGVNISTGIAHPNTGINILPGALQLVAPHLRLLARRAGVHVDEMEYTAEKLRAALQKANLTAERLNVTADVVNQTARNVYQKVEEVVHSRVGRLRQVVEEACHMTAKKYTMRAKKDVFIDGRTINLG